LAAQGCPHEAVGEKGEANELAKRKEVPGVQTFERLNQRGLPTQERIKKIKGNTRQHEIDNNRANKSSIQLTDPISLHNIPP
jgi:hypothetical protein